MKGLCKALIKIVFHGYCREIVLFVVCTTCLFFIIFSPDRALDERINNIEIRLEMMSITNKQAAGVDKRLLLYLELLEERISQTNWAIEYFHRRELEEGISYEIIRP